jgi:putative peptide zinc metalloprotease protein
MASPSKTFSESWYRIADQSISLRSSVRAHRQFYRGEKWYVLQDPYNNRFFRLRPAAYEFAVRLREGKTVEEVWKECLDLQGEEAPGQQEVVTVLSGLYHANMLRYQSNSDSVVLFKRFEKEKERELKFKLLGFMFPKITLFDPDRLLRATLPYVGKLISRWGFGIWVVVMIMGVKGLIDNFDMAVSQAQGILAPSNLAWLYLCLVGIKVLHEFGHAYFCRNAGGEVHRMGVMFLIFTPLPFVDATSSWSLRSRFERIVVTSAGVMVELFVAAVAAIIWSNTGEGLVHSICYNLMFIASVSTLLFNANPLLRFDGYYVLSDILDIPNLHERSRREIQYVVKRFLFGLKKEESVARSRKESVQLIVFSILSNAYRLVVFSSIILFVAGQLMVVGVLLALFFVVSWVIVPIGRFLHYLAASPELVRNRARAVGAVAGIVVVMLGFLRLLPFPDSFDAPGILEAGQYSRLYVRTPGRLERVNVESGSAAGKGDVLLELRNPELDFQLLAIEARLKEAKARQRQAMDGNKADMRFADALVGSIEQQRNRILEHQKHLVITAPYDGVWSGGDLKDAVGCWLTKGMELGGLVSEDTFEFSAVVSQSDASRLFKEERRHVEVKLVGQAKESIEVVHVDKVPMEHQKLPSRALAFSMGGDVETDLSDPTGVLAREPFFRVVARVRTGSDVVLKHGIPGRIRFELPHAPLLTRWVRSFSQMLQKRYRL